MDTNETILKEVAQALYSGNLEAFKDIVLPLLNFDEADELHAPTSSNPDVSMLLKNFCDKDAAYDNNHLDLLEAPDPYFLCEWVDETQVLSPCPDYDEWDWEYTSGVCRNVHTLSPYDSMYNEHAALIETLYDKYGDACVKAQQSDWIRAFYYQILKELNENNMLFYSCIYPWTQSQGEDVSKFLHFLPHEKEHTMNLYTGMLSRSEYKFLLQIKLDYEDALDQFKQSQLYRNAVMLYLGDEALTAFDDTFNAQYNPNSFRAVDIASEDNIIEKLTLALRARVAPTTAAITKSDLRSVRCDFTYPSLDEIAQVERKGHTITEILPNGEIKLYNTYRISGTPAEFICLEELLNHLPYTNEQVLDCIKLCCNSTKLNTVDEILSQLACNLGDYVPYDEKYLDKDGAYEDIGFHFVEGTALEDALKQYHADSCFDYISYGRQLAENNAYCVGEYGYIPHQAEDAHICRACQFTENDVIYLGQYVAGVLDKGTPLMQNGSLVSVDKFMRPLLQRLELCGITLEDVPDYAPNLTTKQLSQPSALTQPHSLADDLQAAQAAANRQKRTAPTPPTHGLKQQVVSALKMLYNKSQNGYNEIAYREGSTFQSDGRCDYRKHVETHAKRSLSGEREPRESLGNKTQLTLLPKQVMLSAHGRHVTVHKRALLHATAVVAPSLNCFVGGDVYVIAA